jgi:hypothetical protein
VLVMVLVEYGHGRYYGDKWPRPGRSGLPLSCNNIRIYKKD